ncbi:hypothetical protein EBE87_22530 [Pseudoroseomonas wenyumeiae]|uniref:Uncharacterized protein n=1 Tax=Teichococcus wenyumeiae TaxID=2478470 RepID=A0A3A9J9F1_9PROT|nr:hypothetical protein [Pseudoroseomonas wenyumeiae]RKK02680.1 hypothetical protein D6Z83_18515 [Pseudoroseomonas wenyumeiae]RMI17426.1 hypothetical protein EBE87_22530 [Pseudoroseomonas wenyumeiae]
MMAKLSVFAPLHYLPQPVYGWRRGMGDLTTSRAAGGAFGADSQHGGHGLAAARATAMESGDCYSGAERFHVGAAA